MDFLAAPLHGILALALAMVVPSAAADSAGSPEPGEASTELVTSPEPDWPQWRGPRRDGRSDETGLLQAWPPEGPPRLWSATGLGRGYSAPIVVGDRIYLAGDVGDELRIFALDGEGRRVWESGNGRSWKTPYPGARAACTYSEGHLYHLNAHGRLACLEAATGREVWSANILERFGGENLTWAMSECVVVDGSRVVVTPGGTEALMAALDKRTGATIWATEPLRLGVSPSPEQQRLGAPEGEADSASYTSPLLLQAGGRRVLVSCSLRHVFAVDAEEGRLLWTRPMKTRYGVIAATPVLVDDAVFVTAPDTDEGGMLLGFTESGTGAERRWWTPLDTCHGGLVPVGDHLYGSWYRRKKGWAAVSVVTGQVVSSLEGLAKGSVLYADGRLVVLSEEGEAALLKPSEGGLEAVGRFRLVPGRVTDVWTHPVLLGGRLYLRHHDTLHCFDVRER